MAPSRTALWGMWALVSAVQLVLNGGHLNLSKNWLHLPPIQFVHPLQILQMHKGCSKGALAQLPERWFGAMMFGELWSGKNWCACTAWWAEAAGRVVRQGSAHCASKEYCHFDMIMIAKYSAGSVWASWLVFRNKLSGCQQWVQTDGSACKPKTVKTVRQAGIHQAATTPTRLVYIQHDPGPLSITSPTWRLPSL